MVPASIQTNLAVTTPATRRGTTLTAHATPHTEAAAYTELIASTGAETQIVCVHYGNSNQNGVEAGVFLDLATGAAASETAFINDLLAGNGTTTVRMGRLNQVYRVIAASSRISGRIRAVISAETIDVAVALLQACVHIEDVGASVSYGTNTGTTRGTSVTGANDDWGTWTEIGTTSEAHNLLFPSIDLLGDLAINETMALLQIGYGATAPDAGGTAINATWQAAIQGLEE